MPAHTESQSRRLEMLGEQEFVRSEPAANKPLDFEAGASRRPVSLILRIILGIVVCGLIAAAFFIGREVGTYESRQQTPAAAPFAFSCDARCVASAARLQGADVLTSVDALVHSIEVTFAAEADEGVGCDPNVTLRFPAYSVTLNPSLPTKLTTAETRVEPSVTFSCTSGKTCARTYCSTMVGHRLHVRCAAGTTCSLMTRSAAALSRVRTSAPVEALTQQHS